MKSSTKTKFYLILLIMVTFLIPFTKGQIIFTSDPDSSAQVGELYTYDVEAVAAPGPATFSLDESPAGMAINSTSGLIQWTPTNVNQGGKVIVKAVNTSGTFTQEYYVYVTDEVSCPTGLFNYWKFDSAVSAGDSTSDYSGTNDAVALVNMTDTIGKVGQALKFNRINATQQFLTVKDVNQYDSWTRASDFSFSLWFKHVGAYTSDECFITRGEGSEGARIILGIDQSSQKVVFRVRNNQHLEDTTINNVLDVLSSSTFTNNQWHHVAAVYDGNANNGTPVSISIYLDGVKTSFTNWIDVTNGFNMTTPQNLNIGWYSTYSNVNSYAFNGYMDEVAIYNKLLTQTDVNALYNAGNPNAICSPGNFAPIITSTAETSVDEDEAYSYKIEARDYEGTALTKEATTLPSWLSFDSTSGMLTGTPENENVGDTVVVLTVSDGEDEATQTINIAVNNTNDVPVITSEAPATAINEDVVYTYTIEAADVDAGDVLTYSAPVRPSWLTFDPESGILTGTPTNAVLGTSATVNFAVTLRVTDQHSATTDLSFTITVTNVNDAPSVTGKATLDTDEDVAIELGFDDLTVTDVDNTYPNDFTLNVKDGTNYTHTGNVITPAANYHGSIDVNFDLTDGEATLTDHIAITVNSVNDAPVFTSQAILLATEGTLYSLPITASDVDGDALTFTIDKKPEWLQFSETTKVLGGIPGNGNVGSDSVVIRVSDGNATAYLRYLLTVNGVQTAAPVITSTPETSVIVGDIYSYTLTATDEDGDALVFSVGSKPAWLIFSASSGLLTGSPAMSDLGDNEVTLLVTDGTDTTEQTFTILVREVSGFEDHTLVSGYYPVPVTSEVTFELTGNTGAIIQIIDLSGKVLVQKSVPAGDDKVRIDMSELSSGIYVYKMTGDNQFTQVGKVVKK